MKTNFRKSIAMIVCVCFLFTGLVGNYVYAESTTGTSNMKIVQNDDNICKVVGEYDEGTAYATLNKNTNEVTLETVEKSKNKIFGFGKGKSKKYKVKVDKSNSEELTATIVDEETKQEHKLSRSKSKVKAQAPLVIPLAFGVAELIAFLLACAATITIAGVVYYAATDIAEKLRRKKEYNYYAAALDQNKTDVYIAGPYPNDAAAFAAVRAGGNVFAISNAKANEAARKGGNGVAYGGWAHGSGDGWLPHYHPMANGVQLKPHCWF